MPHPEEDILDGLFSTYLRDFLRRADGRFVRGKFDCCGFAAGWARILRGKPVARHLLREMSTGTAMKTLADGGGLTAMVGEVLEEVGFRARAVPLDFSVCTVTGEDYFKGETVGVFIEGSLWTISEEGKLFHQLNPKVKRSWR